MRAPLFRCLLLTVLAVLTALPVQAEPIRISGRVVLPAGTKGARIELRRLDPPYEERLRTALGTPPAPAATAQPGADGRFALTAPGPGFYRVLAQAEGFLPLQRELVSLERDTELPPATLTKASMAAVKTAPKARLLALGSTSPSGESAWHPAPREAVAGEDGIAKLPYQAGETLVVVMAWPQALAFFVEVRPEAVRELRPTRPVSLEVRGQDDRPVPGALVSAAGFPLTTAGPDGRFTLDLPGPGGMVTVEGPGGQWAEVRLDPAGVAPGEIRTARLQPPRLVTGRVLDADTGHPLAGARVQGETESAVADAEGRFRIALPPRSYGLFLTASAEGYVKADGFPEGDGPATFSLKRAGFLDGVVMEAGGRPVAKARVRALPAPGRSPMADPPSAEVSTDAAGRFHLPGLAVGLTYTLLVDGGDFAPVRRMADVAERPGEPLRITVSPGAAAAGRVLDPGGRPLPGAIVLLQQDRPEDSKPIEALSGPEGRFLLPHLAAGRYDLRVTREGFAPARIAGLEIPADSRAVDLGDVRMEGSAAIEGRVLDDRGRPVSGAQVGLAISQEHQGDRPSPVETGPDGAFRLRDLVRGERYDLWVQADGFVTRQAPGVEAPTAEPLRIELRRGRILAVRVVDPDGRPVPRARLSRLERMTMKMDGGSIGSQSVSDAGETDDEGTLRIGGLEPGVVDLQVEADGFQTLLARGLRVPENEAAGPVEITLARGAVLEGRVLDGDGKPVLGASVRAFQEDAERPFGGPPGATTDDEGRYRLTGLSPGSYQVAADSADIQASAQAPVEIRAAVQSLDLRFPKGSTVSGQVVDDRGSPVAQARISLAPNGPATLSQADGTFTFRSVADGAFRLRGAAPGFAETTAPDEIQVAGRPVRGLILRLGRGVSIAGRLLGVDPDRLAGARILALLWEPERQERLQGTVDRQGSYQVANASPGTWQVRAELRDGRSAQGQIEVAEVEAGPVALDLEFEEGLTLSGRVLLDGEPLAGGTLAVDGSPATLAYDGGFSVSGLKPGPHRIDILGGPGLGQALQIEMSRDEEMTIPLSTGSISGRVLSPEGLPLGGAIVDVAAEQPDLNASFEGLQVLTAEDGAFQVPRCIAGSYRLRVHADGFPLAESHILVPPSGSVHTEIALETKE
ncbi:MAG: carboxypeptidase regulatory-like domain-containing protein [Acidobacteriota bacterium]